MFIIITVAFTALLLLFIGRIGSGATIQEQVYAKQIALIIDSAKPGTNVTLYVPQMYGLAEKNKVLDMVSTTPDNKLVVKLAQGKGYSFFYFYPVHSGMIELNSKENTLKIVI